MNKPNPKIGIIGLGTFGKCWLKWLSTSFSSIETYSPDSKESTCNSEEELVQKVEAIFLCVPIGKTEEVLKTIAPLLTSSHLVIDVCSVKIQPVKWMLNNLPKEVKILATHPMFGPQSAATSLKGLNFMYSMVRCQKNDIDWLMDFLENHQVNIVEMTPEEHDLVAAKTQALSFFTGHLLKRVGLPKTPIDTTQYQTLSQFAEQICIDTPELFNDILKYNPYTKEVVNKFLAEANKLYKEKFGE